MPEPNDLILQAYPLGAKLVSSRSPPASIRGSSSVEPFLSDSFLNQAGTTVLLVRHIRLRLPPDQPISDQLASSGVIDDLNFLTQIVTGMYPSNSIMDGSAIGSFLPVLKVSVAALRAVSQCRKLQAFIPAVPEKRAPPMCTLLLARVLLQISPALFFFGPASLFLVPPLLVAFFF
jgi:hypothetical protein